MRNDPELAVELVITYYKIDTSSANSITYKSGSAYESACGGGGSDACANRQNRDITIGNESFEQDGIERSPAFLGATIYHETIHTSQFVEESKLPLLNLKTSKGVSTLISLYKVDEYEAYSTVERSYSRFFSGEREDPRWNGEKQYLSGFKDGYTPNNQDWLDVWYYRNNQID